MALVPGEAAPEASAFTDFGDISQEDRPPGGLQAQLLHGLGLGREPWTSPYVIPANTPFELSSAQRLELILTPPSRGTFTARMEFRHWITGQIQNNGAGVVQTRIVVT